jgi:glucokinase
MRELAWWLGLGLANLANILDPAVIVIGGGLIDAGDVLLDPVREALATLIEGGGARPAIPVLPAALGAGAGAVGAGLLALHYL